VLWTTENGCFAKWNDSKRLLCRGNVNIFGRLLSLAERRFVVTSRECNECIAENQVGFCYELLTRGNDKLRMFSSLYAQKKIAVADCNHVFLLLVRNRTCFTIITS